MPEDANATELEFRYMLVELDREHNELSKSTRRLEQISTYYIIFATALLGGALLIVSLLSGYLLGLALITLSFLAAVVGIFVFLILIALLRQASAGISHVFVRQRYFADKFPDVRAYVYHEEVKALKGIWRKAYNLGTMSFLGLLAFFNALFTAAFVGGGAYLGLAFLVTARQIQHSTAQIVAVGIGLLILVLSLAMELVFLSTNIEQIREFVQSVFDEYSDLE